MVDNEEFNIYNTVSSTTITVLTKRICRHELVMVEPDNRLWCYICGQTLA
ncbi:MAG: hypothetical protein IT245_07025 [Bacteroidia bacterium]|nr:hypothetical protein [Bacteroidia bacterium]